MKTLKLNSKLMDLQGETISESEGESLLSQIQKILDLRDASQISIAETGKRIRRAAWKIAEDLRLNELALSSGSDQSLVESLPILLKA